MKKVTVTVASHASDETKEYIAKGFFDLYGAECEFVTDDTIIGGFVAAYDGKIWDQSIRTQLEQNDTARPVRRYYVSLSVVDVTDGKSVYDWKDEHIAKQVRIVSAD